VKYYMLLFVALLGLSACSQQSAPNVAEGVLEDEAFTGVTLHLNPSASNANDSNDGGQAKPLKTLQGMFDKMIPLKASGQNVRILLYPGVYRDYLLSGAGGQNENVPRLYYDIPDNDAQLIFQATEKGKTIISGSDVWTNWQNQGGGVWSKAWTFNWGAPGAGDDPFPNAPDIPELAARRELVFVGGKRLQQVLKGSTIPVNGFSVDEAANRITLKLPSGVNPNTTTTEVGVRSRLFYVWNRNNISLRGLVFQHSVDTLGNAAVAFQKGQGERCSGSQVVDTVIRQNGQTGLDSFCDSSVFLRNDVSDNGFMGMSAADLKSAYLADNLTNRNGWRAWSGGYKGWSTAGLKYFSVQNVAILRHTSTYNLADGFWIDFDNKNIRLEDSLIAHNAWNGLFFEASDGPFVARRNTICDNGLSDVIFGSVRQVTFENNRVLSTAKVNAEIPSQSTAIFFGESRRKETSFITGNFVSIPMRELTLRNNIIVSTNAGRKLTDNYYYFSDPNDPDAPEVKVDYEAFMRTLKLSGNTWYAPQAKPFTLTSSIGYRENFDFAGWKNLTKQDSDSQFSNPGLTCPK
jgi:Right handed beta helix region